MQQLSAQDNNQHMSHRLKIKFNDSWRSYRGEIEDDAAKSPNFSDDDWQTVHVPHAPKILPLRHPWKPDNEAINWYRKHFSVPISYADRKISVEFEGADQVADVWVNGQHLTKHIGSFLPFSVDITDLVKLGDHENVIAVKVDNFQNRDIPVYGSWISYGGLYRDVYLHVTDPLHITDAIFADKVAGGGVFVTYPLVTETEAKINVRTNVLNEYAQDKKCVIKTRLVDAAYRPVAMAESTRELKAGSDFTFDQDLYLAMPKLWHPNHPYLYRIRSEIHADGKLLDHYETRIGVRKLDFSIEGFKINGEPFYFMGTNRVQEYPYVAWAVPNSAQRRDAIRLKEACFQYIRTSHYPQDPSFLDACDELGILVMDSIPGFQFVGGEEFKKNSYENMRQMIRRDRNHPSVILWELSLNESDFDSSFAKTAVTIGHEEYPGDQCFVAGWKFSSIYDVFIQASQHGARNYKRNKPMLISEYGHWDYGGGNSTSDSERKDGEADMLQQALNHQESLSVNRGLPYASGDGLWVAMDFQAYPSGVIDYFRIPKFSYYFYQSQRDSHHLVYKVDSGPMVYIANYWTEHSPNEIRVYSNCDSIKLLLNDRFVSTRQPDTTKFTENLLHPPFTFSNITWQPGTLKAIGYIHGKIAAVHSQTTPGEAVMLDLSFEMEEAALADGEDLFFVYASVIDERGTIVRDIEKEVHFQVTGSGMLLSPGYIKTEAGIAAALIRTTTEPGLVVINAGTEGLKEAVASKRVLK